MKKIINKVQYLVLAWVALVFSGCELAGLEFQKNEKYEYSVLDPKVNMTAWEFLNLPRQDTLFNMMVRGIKYAGLEEEYKKPNRTFLLHTWTVYLRKNSNGTLNTGAYFAYKKVNGKNAASWKDYPVEDVRDFFLYHIIDGIYSYDNLKPDNTVATTLLDGPENTIQMLVVNDRDSRIQINNFPNTKRTVTVRTSNIQLTNGVAHVLDGFLEPGEK
jgi:uncharacterized surface protein with fasciclin (FAS1) repeats